MKFEYLKDGAVFHLCLLVKHLWYEVSVQILWKNIQKFNALIACLASS